jgi:hypothetical protein
VIILDKNSDVCFRIRIRIRMKTRRLIMLGALLGALVASGVSASADEKLNDPQTGLSNTTISGYVDVNVTIGGKVQPPAPLEHESWWQALLLWFGFHAR